MKQPFQFSLWALLLNIAGVAILIGLTFSVALYIALPSLVIGMQLVLAALVIVIVYSRSRLKVFAIGALVPLSIAVLGSAQYLPVVINWRTVSLPEDNPVNAIILGDANDTPENIRGSRPICARGGAAGARSRTPP